MGWLCRVLSHEFGVVRLNDTEPSLQGKQGVQHLHKGINVCRVPIHYFQAVELQRTSSKDGWSTYGLLQQDKARELQHSGN